MASGFTVATRFTATGNLGRELGRIQREFGQLGKLAGKAKSAIIGIGTGAVVGGAAALAYGVREAGAEFINLDQAVTNAASKWGDAFDRGTEGFSTLMEAAKNVGLTTEHQAAQAAEGLNFLAMAGFTAEESLALLPGVANLATAGNLDFARSTDVASDALGAFGMAHGDASQKSAAFSKIMGQVAATVNKANTDINQWFEAVQQGAPSFTTAGQSMASFNTAVALLANNGIKGEKAGTALRGVMANLSKTSGKQATTLRSLGVSVKDSSGNFRDFADIMEDLEKGMVKMGTAQRVGVLEKIFGKQQMSQMAILLGEGADRFREFRAEIENSAGAEVKLATKMRKSVQNSIKLVQSALVGKGIDIIQELFGGEDPAEALTNLATAIQEFDTRPLVEGLREAGRMLRDLGKWLYDNREMLKSMGKAFLAFKAGGLAMDLGNGIAALTEFGKASKATTGASIAGFSRLSKVIRGTSAVLTALIAVYEAAKFAVEGIEENQKQRLERVRQDAATQRAFDRADVSQMKTENVERLLQLERENAPDEGWGSAEAKKENRRRITMLQSELARRANERVFEEQRKNKREIDAQPWVRMRNYELAAQTTQAPQRTESIERTESVNRFEVDWGKPPEGVTINEMPAGVMP